MSRTSEFMRPAENEINDFTDIIDDADVTIDVFRRVESGDSNGFEDDIPDYSRITRIKGRIDRGKGKGFQEIVTEGGEGIKIYFLGIVANYDVQKNDEWRTRNHTYIVRAFDDISDAKTEVLLEIIK